MGKGKGGSLSDNPMTPTISTIEMSNMSGENHHASSSGYLKDKISSRSSLAGTQIP
jgi:hypothetical protein